MTDEDLPPLFHAADQMAIDQQSRFLQLQRTELGALAATALLFELAWIAGSVNLAALAGAACLAVAAGCRLAAGRLKPEERWYVGRAVAESVRSLAWIYAAGGSSFPVSTDEDGARAAFNERLANIVTAPGLRLDDSGDHANVRLSDDEVTPAMEQLRSSGLPDRQAAYLHLRVQGQLSWYKAKAEFNHDRARRWSVILVAFEVAGIGLGLVQAFGLLDFNWAGVAAAIAAIALAWRQTKQFASLSRSYRVTADEVSDVAGLIGSCDSEAEWPEAVQSAEQAFSASTTYGGLAASTQPSAQIRHPNATSTEPARCGMLDRWQTQTSCGSLLPRRLNWAATHATR